MERFLDKSVLVTGASSGVGRAVAIAISREGGRVVLVGRDSQKLEETRSMMEHQDVHVCIPFDLLELDNYKEMFRMIKENGIVLDGMVHCAGTTAILPLRVLNVNNSMDLFKIHYFAFVELVKNYVKKGVSNGGSIVGISAINAHTPQKCMTAYASAKAAMESACRTLSIELIEKNTRINSVVLGGVKTNMAQTASGVIAQTGSKYENPVQRQMIAIAAPEQVVGPILFLLSDESSYITGRELYADGGLL